MADVRLLAQRAREKLGNRDALTEADAISKAIRGAGITHAADHRRLMHEVGTQFARDKRERRATERRAR